MKKGMELEMRKKISGLVAQRYQRARKKEKGKILDEFVELTGYCRGYAKWLLNNWGKKVVVYTPARRLVMIGKKGKVIRKKRERIYDDKVAGVLKKIWYILDFPCGRRLADYIGEIVPILERQEVLVLDSQTREKLYRISGRTIDRLLQDEKKRLKIKGKKRTKPGMLLKSQIPVRTFADWDETKVGFIEIDLVSHDGGDAKGIYAQTLDATDVLTGWTETICVANKSQMKVFQGLTRIIKQFPFPVLGIDSDNGSEFINSHLTRYCEQNKMTFTRTRPYRKNDNCYVEQKNWHIVRKTVGYWRYQIQKEIEIMNELYKTLRLYTNFFQPQLKLIEKSRAGSKIIKKYDKAQTPYQRIINCADVDEGIKKELKLQYQCLNVVELKTKIVRLQNILYRAVRNNPYYRRLRETKQHKKEYALG